MSRARPALGDGEGERNAGARPLIKAIAFIIVLILLVITGISIVGRIKDSQSTTPETVQQEDVRLPVDIPMFNGAVQNRATSSGDVSIFEYVIPQGSLEGVHKFYLDEMPKNNWSRQASSSDLTDKYSSGTREVTLSLTYSGGKVLLTVRLVKN